MAELALRSDQEKMVIPGLVHSLGSDYLKRAGMDVLRTNLSVRIAASWLNWIVDDVIDTARAFNNGRIKT